MYSCDKRFDLNDEEIFLMLHPHHADSIYRDVVAPHGRGLRSSTTCHEMQSYSDGSFFRNINAIVFSSHLHALTLCFTSLTFF